VADEKVWIPVWQLPHCTWYFRLASCFSVFPRNHIPISWWKLLSPPHWDRDVTSSPSLPFRSVSSHFITVLSPVPFSLSGQDFPLLPGSSVEGSVLQLLLEYDLNDTETWLQSEHECSGFCKIIVKRRHGVHLSHGCYPFILVSLMHYSADLLNTNVTEGSQSRDMYAPRYIGVCRLCVLTHMKKKANVCLWTTMLLLCYFYTLLYTNVSW